MSQAYNIISEGPTISKDEMEGYKDFNRLLEMQSAITVNKVRGRWIKSIFLVVAGVVFLYWLLPLDGSDNVDPKKTKEVIVITKENNRKEVQELNTQKQEGVLEIEKKKEPKREKREEKYKEENVIQEEAVKYNYVDATPVEGLQQLYKYFDSELVYPKDFVKDSIEGTVLVSFVVGNQGEIKQIKVLQSLSVALDNEAIRVIQNMPSWNAATVNQEPVESKLSIPLSFNIKNK